MTVRRGIEGFSGSGNLSKVFRSHGWVMETIDILDGQDMRTYHPKGPVDYCHWSPPCPEYSYGVRGRTFRDLYKADRDLWLHALRANTEARPRYWTLENVKGAQQVWGRAPYHFGPMFIWGYFPEIKASYPWTDSLKGTHNYARSGGKRFDEGRSAADKAIIPTELAEAICKAVTDALDREDEQRAVIASATGGKYASNTPGARLQGFERDTEPAQSADLRDEW